MYELVYMSSGTKFLLEEDIRGLLQKSRQYNLEHNITGILLYIDGDFLQILEGNKNDVYNLFSKIQTDTRHKGIIVVHEGKKVARQFNEWTMGFHSSSYKEITAITGLNDISKNNLQNIGNKKALLLLNTFVKSHSNRIY
ncbi:BLUF domain-containing protein [Flavobacterium sp. j3]|uniref:BLUF domain-containing protein n=1 Tax=Flavobacterium aureirubrum TaxID=3133147 RepID=A0ABU9N772_9FLAO